MKQGIDYIGVCVVYFCHDGQGNFVMNKRGENCRDEVGKWDIGGGALELGEKYGDRLKQEIKEEFCTNVLDYEFLGFRDMHRIHQGVKTHWLALDFKVLVDKEKVKNGEPHKFDEIAWFTLDNMPVDEESHSSMPLFFKKYEDKLKKL